MSTCSNCYSGCVEIQSDKCVKYTGLDIELLGIKNGDSLNYVASCIAGFLVTVLDGSGIKYELDAENLCTLVSDELTDCTDITVVEITNALSKVICDMDTRVDALETFVTTQEGDYTPSCVPGITGSEGTRAVLQAVINHLCTVASDLDALELNVATNYVLIADINTYIQAYLDGLPTSSLEKDKMVPYTVVEYYGTLSNFDASGAGTGDWIEIYLCNGNNGTPDKRGRIPVGATSAVGGGSFPPETDPADPDNPTYNLNTTAGANAITLNETQIPSHTHSASTSSSGAHTHGFAYPVSVHDGGSGDDNRLSNANNISSVDITATTSNGAHTHTVTVNPTGGGLSHSNIPPVLACYYIMHIPS